MYLYRLAGKLVGIVRAGSISLTTVRLLVIFPAAPHSNDAVVARLISHKKKKKSGTKGTSWVDPRPLPPGWDMKYDTRTRRKVERKERGDELGAKRTG